MQLRLQLPQITGSGGTERVMTGGSHASDCF
jgi:hypothetical protein